MYQGAINCVILLLLPSVLLLAAALLAELASSYCKRQALRQAIRTVYRSREQQ